MNLNPIGWLMTSLLGCSVNSIDDNYVVLNIFYRRLKITLKLIFVN